MSVPLPVVTIVIPVHNYTEGVLRCIASCKEHVDPRHTILIVDDASTDPALEQSVRRSIEGHPSFRYERNTSNMGFVRTCNHAVMHLDPTDRDILLLNSDVIVTAGFLEEMHACLWADPVHAVCSPRSDDATILTFPYAPGMDHIVPKCERYALWRAHHARFPRCSRIPTAVGFCMLIRRSVIRQFGLFDEAYRRGYEEENDFCLRIIRQGWAIVTAHHAFVFHESQQSFSQEERDQLEAENYALLLSRYPEYADRIRAYPPAELALEEWKTCAAFLQEQNRMLRVQREEQDRLATQLHRVLHSRSWRWSGPVRRLEARLRGRLPTRESPADASALPVDDTSQHGEVALLRTMLPPDSPRFLVDVGAHDGLTLSNSLPFIRSGWSALLIEPHPALFRRLRARHERNHAVRCVRSACADTRGRRFLYEGTDPLRSMSTIDLPAAARMGGEGSSVRMRVKTDTLTRILLRCGAPSVFSLLLIDAEEMDLEVLQGLDFSRFRPLFILTENSSYPWKNTAKETLLAAAGYVLQSRIGCNAAWASTRT